MIRRFPWGTTAAAAAGYPGTTVGLLRPRLNQFEALQGSSGHDWIIDVGPGVVDVVGVADGTDDLASMPRQLLDGAAEWLGGPPQYRLALTIGESPACRDLAWRIAEEFARSWPAVWSNHTDEPVAPLGTWWAR